MYLRIALILQFLWFADVASADWSLRIEKDDIRVESRPSQDGRYQEFRASMRVATGLGPTIALLRDTDACTVWLFRCQESRVIEEVNQTERTFYQVSSLPFPAKSRDAIFHAAITYRDDKSVLISLDAKPDLLPETGHVRIRHAHGSYLLKPLGQQTEVIWQQYVDPAGRLPAWIVNAMLTDLPFQSLLAFRELVLTPPYSQAELVYDQDGVPMDIRTLTK